MFVSNMTCGVYVHNLNLPDLADLVARHPVLNFEESSLSNATTRTAHYPHILDLDILDYFR